MQEDGMRPGRARSLASSLTTVAPEEETFWALQGLSVMGRCGWQGCQPVKGEHCPTLRISGACAPPQTIREPHLMLKSLGRGTHGRKRLARMLRPHELLAC
jgi:hypothetical protein